MQFGGTRMLEFDMKIVNTTWHTDATASPFGIIAHKYIPCNVELHTLDLLEHMGGGITSR